MHRLLNKLNSSKLSLIVSIPENSYELAKLAWEAGADAIKVHINVFHRASQNHFGTLKENEETFKRILKDSPIPVGIVLGEDAFTAEKEADEAIKMGFDFISLYGHHTPASLLYRKEVDRFFAINYTYDYDEIDFICKSKLVDIMELSICLPESYGERLNARDLARYEHIAKLAQVPTVVPTQHVVYPTDVEALYKCGISAIMIGAISTGKEKTHIAQVIAEFRKEIDKL